MIQKKRWLEPTQTKAPSSIRIHLPTHIEPPRNRLTDIASTQSTMPHPFINTNHAPLNRHQSNISLIRQRMTRSTDRRTTAPNQGNSTLIPPQARHYPTDKYQPAYTNEEYQSYTRKTTSEDRGRSIEVSILVEHVDGDEEEALREDPVCGYGYAEDGEDVSVGQGEEIRRALRSSR